MNSAKNSSDEPRSFSSVMITIETAHATSTGPRCFGIGQSRTEARPRRHAEQLAPLDEVRREEDGEHDLGELAGLEVDRSDVRPDASTVDLAADHRRERRHQQQQAEQEERVAVALQITRAADDDQAWR